MFFVFLGAEYVFDTKGTCKIYTIPKRPDDAVWDTDHLDKDNKTAYLLLATGTQLFQVNETTTQKYYQGPVSICIHVCNNPIVSLHLIKVKSTRIHSSRMRTYSRGAWGGGVCPVWCLPGGGVCAGGGVCLGGVCPQECWDTHTPRGRDSWHTPVKTLHYIDDMCVHDCKLNNNVYWLFEQRKFRDVLTDAWVFTNTGKAGAAYREFLFKKETEVQRLTILIL